MICNIGNNKQEIIRNLFEEKINFHTCEEMPTIKVGKSDVPEIELTQFDSLDKIERMSFETMSEAMQDACLSVEQIERGGERISLSFATSLYGIEQSLKGLTDEKQRGLWYLYTRRSISKIAQKYKIKGSIYTTSSACASGTAGAILGYDLIRNDEADIVLVGGADYISSISLKGFNSLQALSKNLCKPFDVNRNGINIGEGSAFFVFEEFEHARKRGKKWYGEIIGGGLANEAYHMTSPNPDGEGAHYAMEAAIKQANISSNQIDYINAHGTGTKANDTMELTAIEQLLGNKESINTFVSSTKSRTGHCLGSAGSIELGFCLLAISNCLQLKTVNTRERIEDKFELLKSDGKNIKIEHALSNSFAFGGHIASIAIKR
jgi:3-oxoacyl-[acyl-carrier-protein] synthase II